MAHGQPDFGMYTLAKTIYRLTDMGELAARLGSPITFDRRGDVVWIETFNESLSNWSSAGDTGYSVTQSAEKALSGGISCKTVAPNKVDTLAQIVRRTFLPVSSRIGLEFAFLPDTEAEDIILYIWAFDGSSRWQAVICIDLSDDEITYMNDAASEVVLATGVNVRQSGDTWHIAKLVIDLANDEYVRFRLDNVEYSMAGLGMYETASSVAPYLSLQLWNSKASPSATITVYFDNVILTQNEP